MKVMIANKYEVEVLDMLVTRFLYYTNLPLETRLTFFIRTDLDNNVDEAFQKYPIEKINKTLNQCMIDELNLHGESSIYDDLDKIGYSDYWKPDWV